MTKTFVNVERRSETTKEDVSVFTTGAYMVEVHHTNDKLIRIFFKELDETAHFARSFSDPQELVILRNLFTAVLMDLGVEDDNYHFSEKELYDDSV